tara:strand:- start:3288 stop:3581 length:294 start_codon:yes stop_codon:yes gene_type:complete
MEMDSILTTNMHELFMSRAIELAKQGRGHVSPNPMVGCVLVLDGDIIGEGYHEEFGGPHAEVMAMRNARKTLWMPSHMSIWNHVVQLEKLLHVQLLS